MDSSFQSIEVLLEIQKRLYASYLNNYLYLSNMLVLVTKMEN